MKIKKQEIIAIILIIFAAASRLLPHPANFAPISAVAIFGAFYLRNRKLALILPLIAMFISDSVIGFYHWPIMLFVYLSFLISTLLGFYLKKKQKNYCPRENGQSEDEARTTTALSKPKFLTQMSPFPRPKDKKVDLFKNISNGVAISLLASIQFYIITNFAVWIFGTMYSKNLAGLINCYFMAIPFFRNTILGDLFYIGVLFSAYSLVNHFIFEKSEKRAFSKAK